MFKSKVIPIPKIAIVQFNHTHMKGITAFKTMELAKESVQFSYDSITDAKVHFTPGVELYNTQIITVNGKVVGFIIEIEVFNHIEQL